MKEYIAKKLLLLIPTVLAITLLVFAMMPNRSSATAVFLSLVNKMQ